MLDNCLCITCRTAGEIMKPEKIIEEVKHRVTGDLNGMVIFSGTLPTLSGNLSFSPRFEVELIDEHLQRAIKHAYTVEPISWFQKQG
ncbi:hypothetical protein ES703_71506 [subsurface metagenome]